MGFSIDEKSVQYGPPLAFVLSGHDTQITSLQDPSLLVDQYESNFDMPQFTFTLFLRENVEVVCESVYKDNHLIRDVFTRFNLRVIEPFAFENAKRLQNLHTSTGLQTIGEGAFRDCSIELLNLETSTALVTIGREAFAHNKLISLTFAEDGVPLTIENGAFMSCELDELVIPKSIINIDDVAFADNRLEKIDFTSAVHLKRIGAFAFMKNCGPDVLDLDGCKSLTEIGEFCFASNKKIEHVICLPPSLVKLDYFAMTSCTSLKSIDFAAAVHLTIIAAYAFYECKALQNVVLPPSVTKIEEGVFAKCTSLKYVKGKGVTVIKKFAFFKAGLKKINFPGLVEVREEAFAGCVDLYLPGSTFPEIQEVCPDAFVGVTTDGMFANMGYRETETYSYDDTERALKQQRNDRWNVVLHGELPTRRQRTE